MKKSICLLVLCICSSFVCGQQVTFHHGEKSGKKLPTQRMTHMLPSFTDGQVLAVEYELNTIGNVKAVRVRQINEEWKESASVKIPDTRGNIIEAAFRMGDHIHLLISDFDKKYFHMRHVVVSAAGLKIESDSLLLDITLTKGEVCYDKTAISPDSSLIAVTYVIWDEKNDRSQAHAILFDNSMQRLWSRQLRHGYISQMLVTNNGEVVTASLLSNPKKQQETLLCLNEADAMGAKSGEGLLEGDLEQVALLNYSGGKVLCAALEGEGVSGLVGKWKYTAFHALLYDMNASSFSSSTRHAFTEEEIATFANEDFDDKQNEKSINYVYLIEQETTPKGGAVVYQRSWREITRNKYGVETSETVYRKGILLANLDTLGNILWVRGIMQNNQNAKEVEVSADLMVRNGIFYLFTNESKDESNEYTPSVAAKRSKNLLTANAALAVYRFSADGEGSKQMLATDDKYILHSPLFDFGNGKYYLLAGGMGPKICSVFIP